MNSHSSLAHKLLCICSLFFILLSLNVPIVDSSVNAIDIVPDSPKKGDIVRIFVRANPMEELSINIVFQDEIQVQDGLYDYLVAGIRIPSSTNMFSVWGEGVSDLYVSIEIPFSVTMSSDSNDGIAFFSVRNIPEGIYEFRIHGHILDGISKVNLNFNAEFIVHADKNGLYEYRYNTKGIPAGVFTVYTKGFTREITILPQEKIWKDYIFPYDSVFVLVGGLLITYFLYRRGYISIEINK